MPDTRGPEARGPLRERTSMALKIEVAELGLAAIDALDVDALAVFVGP